MSSRSIEQPAEVAGFIAKTFEILSNDEFAKIIYWAPSGTEFVIKDVSKLQQVVLPRYFRHAKMNSFIRQLNMYGFHKSRNDHVKSVFSHPLFQRDRSDLLITIKRKIKGKLNQGDEKGNVQNQEEMRHQTPNKKTRIQAQETTTPKDLAETGRELRSTRQISFTEQNKTNTFSLLLGSRERLGSRMSLGMSLRRLSSRQMAAPLQLQQQSECVSIQQKIEKPLPDLQSIKFMNPSCFFTSIRK